jgi:MFS family permease
MKRWGRRAGFTLGAACAIVGSMLCALALYAENLWILCAGTLVLGAYFAAGQYYRFAAADVAPVAFRSKAISLVLAGGIIGGFFGPETSKLTKDLVAGHIYAGAYLSLIVFALAAMAVMRWLDIPPPSAAERKAPGRPLSEIVRQPAFAVAVLCGMIGYGVMNLLMTATPLAMVACQHPFGDAAFVIQWHLVGMFAPSFFTGHLIQRFGVARMIFVGVLLNLVCVAVALSGVAVANFWLALTLLGVGWNFMYIGATTLLTETHQPAERAKAQGVNDMAIFVTMVASSLSSGALFTYQGWQTMNYLAIPFLVVAGAAAVSLAWWRRRAAVAA